MKEGNFPVPQVVELQARSLIIDNRLIRSALARDERGLTVER